MATRKRTRPKRLLSAVALCIAGGVLLIAGVSLWSWKAGIITAGVALLAAGLLFDFEDAK